MPWPLRLIETRWEEGESFRHMVDVATGQPPVVGDAFFVPDWLEERPLMLSDFYRQHNAHRAPLVVVLPGPVHFCVDGNATQSGQGWHVAGEPPAITVSPSILIGGIYHGYVQAGVITDDVEGRTFDSRGHSIR